MDNIKIGIIKKETGLFGGIQNQILNMVKGLVARGYKVFLITDSNNSEFVELVSQAGGVVHLVSFNNYFKCAFKISQFCRKNDVRIIQAHMLKESFVVRLTKILNKKVQNVFRVHTYIDCSHISKHKKNMYHLASWITDRWVDIYIPINEFSANEIINRTRIKRSKVKIIHDGIPSKGIGNENQVILEDNRIAMIANFRPFKGHDILVKGIKLLKDEGYIIQVDLIGGESYPNNEDQTPIITNKIKQLSQQLGIDKQINFWGYKDDIFNIIKNVIFIVLPSYMEGTPNCLLEAMAVKKIVVASNVGGIPEFIEDGINGFLHDVDSPRSFADTIKKVIKLEDDRVKNVTENAYITWCNDYSEDAMINNLVRLYQKIYMV